MNRHREHAQTLLRKAEDDGQVVLTSVGNNHLADWIVGFHAQQAIEKSIKAVLSHHGVIYPHLHQLGILVGLLQDAGINPPPVASRFDSLTPFGAVLRYDDAPADAGSPSLDREAVAGMV